MREGKKLNFWENWGFRFRQGFSVTRRQFFQKTFIFFSFFLQTWLDRVDFGGNMRAYRGMPLARRGSEWGPVAPEGHPCRPQRRQGK